MRANLAWLYVQPAPLCFQILGPAAAERQVPQECLARTRSVGIYGMSTYRSTHDTEPPQLVFGFGNTSQRAIRIGVSAIADLLSGAC